MSDTSLSPVTRALLLSFRGALESAKVTDLPVENPFEDIGPAPDGPLATTHREPMVARPEDVNLVITRIDEALSSGTLGAALPLLRLIRTAIGAIV